jgi:hypothetical protein
MNTESKRQAFRKRLEDLSEQELTQWNFLVGLVARVECELEAYHALFAPDVQLDPAPDTQMSTAQFLLTQELKKRNSVKAKAQLPTTGENNHADHAQTGTQ